MHFHAGGVQRHRLDAYPHNLLALQLFEYTVEHATLAPATHPRVYRVPVTKSLRQTAPLAAMFCDVQDGIEYRSIAQAHVAPLQRKAMFDLLELGFANLHSRSIRETHPQVN